MAGNGRMEAKKRRTNARTAVEQRTPDDGANTEGQMDRPSGRNGELKNGRRWRRRKSTDGQKQGRQTRRQQEQADPEPERGRDTARVGKAEHAEED
jgi:hypothetical protein